MRLLIWCLCAFVFEMVHIILNKSGFHFGFLEAFIFYGLLFYTATNLSNKLGAKWENSRLRKKAEKEGMSPAEYAKKDIPKMFLLEIENRSNDRNSLSGYLTMCVKEKIISRAQANAILEDFGKK